jgi:gamma-glutamylcysteine synthetase
MQKTWNDRINKLAEEKNIPALVQEARNLVTDYVQGTTNVDLEALLSAQEVLSLMLRLVTTPFHQHKEQSFVALAIKKSDLKDKGISEEILASLTDEDMQIIASKLADVYMEAGFMESYEIVTKMHLTFDKTQ